jgi:hypothetical protein
VPIHKGAFEKISSIIHLLKNDTNTNNKKNQDHLPSFLSFPKCN